MLIIWLSKETFGLTIAKTKKYKHIYVFYSNHDLHYYLLYPSKFFFSKKDGIGKRQKQVVASFLERKPGLKGQNPN